MYKVMSIYADGCFQMSNSVNDADAAHALVERELTSRRNPLRVTVLKLVSERNCNETWAILTDHAARPVPVFA